jgi:hypothetical protein
MSDQIGRITVPSVTASVTFPLVTQWPHGQAQKRTVVTHTFGAANAKVEQRFASGFGATRFLFQHATLKRSERNALRNFWDSMQGAAGAFFYSAPNEDNTFTTHTVCFENVPLSFEDLTGSITRAGLTMVDIPDPALAPSYTVTSTVTRFPDSTLATNLTSQVQVIIPLLHIRVLDPAYNGGNPDVYLSDRRVTVAGQLYLPRLLNIGDPKSDALITQSMSTDGAADDVTFSLGNADRVMVQFANDTQLRWGRVELSLLRVDSLAAGTVLKLWAGYIVDWRSDAGPVFTLKASDLLSALQLMSPVSTVSRTCWRRFALDGCPATIGGACDTTHFPDASVPVRLDAGGSPIDRKDWCDLGYNTPNGCMAQQVQESYGATYCSPQNVLLRSGGVGFSFNPGLFLISPLAGLIGPVSTWYTRTSVVADNIFGAALPEIWHHDDGQPQWGLPVQCKIAAGRDEDQFYIALGIVGKGPLGAYTAPQMYTSYGSSKPDTFLGSTLDGQPNHGFQVDSGGHLKAGAIATYGLRQSLGSDPAGTHDYFSLGRVTGAGSRPLGWYVQTADGTPMEEVEDPAWTGGSATTSSYNLVYSSGVAFCEIRRTKPNSDPLTSPLQHTMLAMISQGLSGLVWSAPGAVSTVAGLTNPFWIAVNTYLRAIGILGATTSTQEGFFDVASAVACAAIADTSVDAVIGTGTETQFRFKGIVNDRRANRDWLQSILNAGLGFFTWNFGALTLGCRENASATAAFTSGNMLYQSLVIDPLKPRFEKLTGRFSDQDYSFQDNTVDYTDQDYAARNSRSQNPLASELPLSGSPTKSQTGRIITVRAREELGGITQAEQDAARNASFKTTILALDTAAGKVISITDPDLPGGFQKFRIRRWTLNRDWSIDIEGPSVTDSTYNLAIGPKPSDVPASPVPIDPSHFPGAPPAPPWEVGYETPITGDPLFVDTSFGVVQDYTISQADGSPEPRISVYGDPPAKTGILLQVRRELVSGPFSQTAASISTGVIALGGSGITVDFFKGRVISKIANALTAAAGPLAMADFTVTGNDANGNFSVTPDPVAAGCVAGDQFSLRTGSAGGSTPVSNPLTADATSFTDPVFINYYNSGGLTSPNANAGNLVLVIAGTGAGQAPRSVESNTTTKVTVSPAWDVVPDATSVIVLVEAVPQDAVMCSPKEPNASSLLAAVQIPNYANQVVRVEAYLVNTLGQLGFQEEVAFREIYIWGAQGTRLVVS